jgi:hypothetical protein
MGGTGYAAATITGADVKNSSLTGKDVKNKSLSVKDFKGSVAGPQGPAGPAGAVRAFGSFTNAGLPTSPTRVKNLTATHPTTGVYCLSSPGIDVSTSIPVASTDFSGPAMPDTITMVRSVAPQCPPGTWELDIFDASAGTPYDAQFSVLIP